MKITLAEWAARNFMPAPCRQTLYKWRKEGRISPAPQFCNRNYWVDDKAQLVGLTAAAPTRKRQPKKTAAPRLVERIA
ncbi:excisionase [Amantichitinum ursilacus]|uniref:excisionase n=1 Tax=Amantichitinum ursilacus TaxID=857265 RepID=UPI0006B43C46|nr:excisionase [Amantichitinum ursilacus]